MTWRKRMRVQLLEESEAQGRTAEVYREVREALGIPYVPEVYRAWGTFPQFLDLHWRGLRPVLHSQEFFSLAERLRADAYTRAHNYFEIPDLRRTLEEAGFPKPAFADLYRTLELFHYVNPAVLLILAAQWEALERPVGTERPPMRPAVRPAYSMPPPPVEEAAAPPPVRKIFAEMRRTLGLPHADFKLRVLARWPEFLLLYWEVLRAAAALPLYSAAHTGLRETAWALTRELPGTFETTDQQLLEAGMDAEEITGVVRITELYLKNTSAMALNLSLARIAVEGGNQVALPAVAVEVPHETGKRPPGLPESAPRRGVA